MRSLLLLGGGDHCRACIDVIEAGSTYRIAGIVQQPSDGIKAVQGYPVVGVDDDLPRLLAEIPRALVVTGQIKTAATRIRLYETVKSYAGTLPVITSPMAYCSPRASLGEGTILMHGSIVNTNAAIGENCIINSLALIEHDSEIEAHCHISTGARINGGVHVGEGSFIGSGAIVKEGVKIGQNVVVGAGQIILRDVPAATIIRGNREQ